MCSHAIKQECAMLIHPKSFVYNLVHTHTHIPKTNRLTSYYCIGKLSFTTDAVGNLTVFDMNGRKFVVMPML